MRLPDKTVSFHNANDIFPRTVTTTVRGAVEPAYCEPSLQCRAVRSLNALLGSDATVRSGTSTSVLPISGGGSGAGSR